MAAPFIQQWSLAGVRVSEEGTKADWDVGRVWKIFTPSLRELSLLKKISSAVKLNKEYKRKQFNKAYMEAVTQ